MKCGPHYPFTHLDSHNVKDSTFQPFFLKQKMKKDYLHEEHSPMWGTLAGNQKHTYLRHMTLSGSLPAQCLPQFPDICSHSDFG